LSHINDTNNSEYEDDRTLAVGAIIVNELRDSILKQTGFRCSAGIAHNKVC